MSRNVLSFESGWESPSIKHNSPCEYDYIDNICRCGWSFEMHLRLQGTVSQTDYNFLKNKCGEVICVITPKNSEESCNAHLNGKH